MYADGGVYDG